MNLFNGGWIFIIFLLIACSVFGQEGDYYVSQYEIEPDRIDNPYFSIVQDNNGHFPLKLYRRTGNDGGSMGLK